MKSLVTLFFLFLVGSSLSQVASSFCNQAEAICSQNGSNFPLTTNGATALPGVLNVSNPGFGSGPNNGNPNSSGCLNSGGPNPNWFVINVSTSGLLEFTIGAAGGAGFFDWAMWPYYDNGAANNACDDIINNILPPVACNWNASSAGFTGMAQQGALPPGANQGNFEFSLNVTAGDQYILCFSNYSFQAGNAQLTFLTNPNSAGITCEPGTPDQTICIGSSATVDIVVPPTLTAPTFNWLVTTGVSNTTGGAGVTVTPTVTTEYHVEIFDPSLPTPVVDTFVITVDIPPVPNAGFDQAVCIGTPISLDATTDDPTNNSVSWIHDVSGVPVAPTVNYAPNANIEDPTVTVNQEGIYLFIFQEDDPLCGLVSDTVAITVDDVQPIASSISPSCFGFADGEIHIDAPGAFEYSFDGGTTWQADSFNVVFNANNYTVCARTALGCQNCTNITVVDPAEVVVSVSNDSTICMNGTASLSASATGGNTYLYHWGHTPDLGANQQVSPLVNTTYTVFAENELGCISATESIDITMYPVLAGTISPFDTICPGYPTNVFANASGGIGQPYTFTWSSGETQTGPDYHEFEVNPPQTTTYTVTINDGCETTPIMISTEVYVAPLPVPQYEILDPIQCEPAVFHIVNTTDPAMSQFNYWFVEPNMEYLNQDTIVTDTLMEGYYDMQMIITSYLGCIDSIYFDDAIYVKGLPKANFAHSPDPVLMFNTGDVFFSNHSIDGYSYEWWFEEGYPSTSTQENVHVAFPDGQVGTYDIKLVTTSFEGCTDTMLYELIVFPEVLIYAPNAFTPDGDEFNQDWRVFMEGIDISDFDLLIFNRWGQVVWESHDVTVPWDGTMNGTPLPNDTYTWVIRASDMLNDGKYEYSGHVTILK